MNTQAALEAARSWIAADPDPITQAELQALVDAEAPELVEVMSGSLSFGTAGLRAVVGAGSRRMNRAVIRRTTAGVARYLVSLHGDAPLVVVGADARLSSAAFQADTVAVLAGYGVRVRYFEAPAATPLVAYVARRLEASAAIVITASHNPAKYNGYKLYGDNAVQIVSPVDEQVAAEIEQSLPANQERYEAGAPDGQHPLAEPVSADLVESYYQDVAALRPPHGSGRDLRIVYTAMHGVGYEPVARVLREAGFGQVSGVESQIEPDGHFPTVAFPNPEEPGALDKAMALSREVGADLIIANDPDVDRLAACLPDGKGGYFQLTGNQVGLLLADALLQQHPAKPGRQALVAQSIVSSPMLELIAREHGARFEQTFTGFKWIWTAALDLMAAHPLDYVFGYEEALGYCAGQLVRDKDGISAALLLCELAAQEKAAGSNLSDRLGRLYQRHGLWVSLQRSVTLEGLEGAAKIRAAMESLGAEPPTKVGGSGVTQVRDFSRGGDERPRWLSTATLIELTLSEGQRVLVRPSGTEPKLKIYVDLSRPLRDGEPWRKLEAPALAEARALAEAMVKRLGL